MLQHEETKNVSYASSTSDIKHEVNIYLYIYIDIYFYSPISKNNRTNHVFVSFNVALPGRHFLTKRLPTEEVDPGSCPEEARDPFGPKSPVFDSQRLSPYP